MRSAPGRRGWGPFPGAQDGLLYQLHWCSGSSQAAVPSEPLDPRGGGHSQGHWLSLCSLGGLRKSRSAAELCEEVVSMYIQNCQLFVYGEVISTYIQNCQMFVYSEVVSTYIQNCQLFVYVAPEPPQPDLGVAHTPTIYTTIVLNKTLRHSCSN